MFPPPVGRETLQRSLAAHESGDPSHFLKILRKQQMSEGD
jgi:hypothetical protein